MNYWLDLYAERTWKDFRKYGARVTGFWSYLTTTVKRIAKGDILLCHLAASCAGSTLFTPGKESNSDWLDADFPVQLEVEPLELRKVSR